MMPAAAAAVLDNGTTSSLTASGVERGDNASGRATRPHRLTKHADVPWICTALSHRFNQNEPLRQPDEEVVILSS